LVTSPLDVVDAYCDAARANACTMHGPVRPRDAATTVAQLLEGSAALAAVAEHDPALRGLAIGDALRGAGARVCNPDDEDWGDALARADVGVTGARLAVAEQGVVALVCGPQAPRATSLLPPRHVCVVFADSVVATFAAAIEQLGAAPLPSALTWIGGPSRTGDLEMVQTLGVHGPKAVDIVLVAVG
jgi:L-lactate dehydrogenase complex protein LldG